MKKTRILYAWYISKWHERHSISVEQSKEDPDKSYITLKSSEYDYISYKQ